MQSAITFILFVIALPCIAVAQNANDVLRELKNKAAKGLSAPATGVSVSKDSLIKCTVSGTWSGTIKTNSNTHSLDGSYMESSTARVSASISGTVYGVYHGETFTVSGEKQQISISGTVSINGKTVNTSKYCTSTTVVNYSGNLLEKELQFSFRFDQKKGQDDFSSVQIMGVTCKGGGNTSFKERCKGSQDRTGGGPIDDSFAGLMAPFFTLSAIPKQSHAFITTSKAQGGPKNLFNGIGGGTFSGNDTIGWKCIGSFANTIRNKTDDNTEGTSTTECSGFFQVSIHPSSPRPEVSIDVSIKDFENWRPQGNIEQDRIGDILQIEVKLVKKNGDPSDRVAWAWHARLENTTQEPGICANYPHKDPTNGYDYTITKSFEPIGLGKYNGTQEITIQSHSSDAVFWVNSFDFGGTTQLKIWCELENGSKLEKCFRNGKEVEHIDIPYRENPASHKTADAWLNLMALGTDTQDDDDNEHVDGQKYNGDGLTVYEEYRGFIRDKNDKNKEHVSLNPYDKDLVLINCIGNQLSGAFDLFSQASKIKVTELQKNVEIDTNDAIINKNSQYAKGGDQYGIVVRNAPAHKAGEMGEDLSNVLGKMMCKGQDPSGNPIPVNKMPTDAMARRAVHIPMVANSPKGVWYLLINVNAADEENPLNVTSAHEISHGLGVQHHGPDNGAVDYIVSSIPHNFYYNNGAGKVAQDTIEKNNWLDQSVQLQHYSNSGDPYCIMCYHTEKFSANAHAKDAKDIIVQTYKVIPTLFCTSPNGKFYNSTEYQAKNGLPFPMFGDCADGYGNCFSMFKVKDW